MQTILTGSFPFDITERTIDMSGAPGGFDIRRLITITNETHQATLFQKGSPSRGVRQVISNVITLTTGMSGMSNNDVLSIEYDDPTTESLMLNALQQVHTDLTSEINILSQIQTAIGNVQTAVNAVMTAVEAASAATGSGTTDLDALVTIANTLATSLTGLQTLSSQGNSALGVLHSDGLDLESLISTSNTTLAAVESNIISGNASIVSALTTLNTSVTGVRTSLTSVQTAISAGNADLDSIVTATSTLQTALANLQTLITASNSGISGISTSAQNIQALVTTGNTTLVALQTAFATANSTLSAINTTTASVTTAVTTGNTLLGTIESSLTTIDADIQTGNAAIATVNTTVTSVNTAIATANTTLASLQSEMGTTSSPAANTLLADLQTLITNLTTSNTNLSSLVSGQSSSNTLLTGIQTAQGSTNTALNTANTTLASISTAQGTTNTDLSQLHTDVTTAITALNTVNTNLGTLHTDLTSINGNLATAVTNLGTLHTDLQGLSTQLTTATSDLSTLITGQTTGNTSLAAINTALGSTNTALGTANTTLTTMSSALSTSNTNLSQLHTDLTTVISSLGVANTNLGTLHTDLAGIQTTLNTMSGYLAVIDTASTASATAANQATIITSLATLHTDLNSANTTLSTISTNVSGLGNGKTLLDVVNAISPKATSTDITNLSSALSTVGNNELTQLTNLNTVIGAQGDAAAGTDGATASLTALFKRLLGKFVSTNVIGATNSYITSPVARAYGLYAYPSAYGTLRVSTEATDLFVEEFDGASIDTTMKWTVTTLGTGTYSVANSLITMTLGTTAGNACAITSIPTFYPPGMSFREMGMIHKISATAVVGAHHFWGMGTQPGSWTVATPIQDGIGFEQDTTGALNAVIYNAGTKVFNAALTRPTDGLMHRYAIVVRPDLIVWYLDGIEVPVAFCTDYSYPSTGKLPIRVHVMNPATTASSQPTSITGALAMGDTANNTVQLSDPNYSWLKANIKPASTAAVATDQGIVISISPNSPVPGIYNQTLPTLANGTTGSFQLDKRARLIISPDSGKATYSACFLGTWTQTAPADVFTIFGSASKTVTVTKLGFSATMTTAGVVNAALVKRSSANTGGTSSAQTAVPHDSGSPAATATGLLLYTANPTGGGAQVGVIRADRLYVGTTASVVETGVEWKFNEGVGKGIVLNGIAEGLCLNMNANTMTGNQVAVYVEWTEE